MPELDEAVALFYGSGRERKLVGGPPGASLEFRRMRELLDRFLPPAPASILDVGGGPGYFASSLAQTGYRVRLVEPVALHLEQARGAARRQPECPFDVVFGDARDLREPDSSWDVVLLGGPLYHLTEASDRALALREARRVLRPGGLLVAHVFSRFFSLLFGISRDLLGDAAFRTMVDADLADGQHRNAAPDDHPEWFTTAFFHTPSGIRRELAEAGFAVEHLISVMGPGWLNERAWSDASQHEALLWAARSVEHEESLLGASDMLIVGRRIS